MEIGLSARGVRGPLIEELSERHPDGDLYAMQLLDLEPNATTLLEHTVYATSTADSTIVSVDARHARTGREIRIFAPLFIDCSGKTILGLHSGAKTLFGQESRAEVR